MEDSEVFERHLVEALPQLYSPTYEPPDLLFSVLGAASGRGMDQLRPIILQAIADLEPEPGVPQNARVRRLYELLNLRYVQGLMQKETAQQLGLTTRHVRREQQQAVRILAQRLWDQKRSARSELRALSPHDLAVDSLEIQEPSDSPSVENDANAWRSQVRQELASLQSGHAGQIAGVASSIHGAVESGRTLAKTHNVELTVETVEPNAMAGIHPVVLREVLLTMISKVVETMAYGDISLRAVQTADTVRISLAATPRKRDNRPTATSSKRYWPAAADAAEARLADGGVEYVLRLPASAKKTILVIDDNAELVRFYEHYTSATRYEIVHVAEGRQAYGVIHDVNPDIIVLDIMLPDIDGWELFSLLRQDPRTEDVPIIICSVVRREEVAKAMGAAAYLQKPIRRQQFLRALDQVLEKE